MGSGCRAFFEGSWHLWLFQKLGPCDMDRMAHPRLPAVIAVSAAPFHTTTAEQLRSGRLISPTTPPAHFPDPASPTGNTRDSVPLEGCVCRRLTPGGGHLTGLWKPPLLTNADFGRSDSCGEGTRARLPYSCESGVTPKWATGQIPDRVEEATSRGGQRTSHLSRVLWMILGVGEAHPDIGARTSVLALFSVISNVVFRILAPSSSGF